MERAEKRKSKTPVDKDEEHSRKPLTKAELAAAKQPGRSGFDIGRTITRSMVEPPPSIPARTSHSSSTDSTVQSGSQSPSTERSIESRPASSALSWSSRQSRSLSGSPLTKRSRFCLSLSEVDDSPKSMDVGTINSTVGDVQVLHVGATNAINSREPDWLDTTTRRTPTAVHSIESFPASSELSCTSQSRSLPGSPLTKRPRFCPSLTDFQERAPFVGEQDKSVTNKENLHNPKPIKSEANDCPESTNVGTIIPTVADVQVVHAGAANAISSGETDWLDTTVRRIKKFFMGNLFTL